MLLIRGGEVVTTEGRRRADVLVDGDRISAVGEALEAPGAGVIDAGGALVIPGGIDVHTHFDLSVGAVRSADDFESGTVAAACGGTTCVVDFAGDGRASPDDALLEWHAKAEGRACTDYGFHLTVTSVPEGDGARELFGGFLERGVASVKLYMAYPERLMVDDDTLRRALAAGAQTGVLVCVHAEDGAEVERLRARELEAGHVGPGALPSSRPASVEASAIRRATKFAERSGAPLYVVHLSSAAGLEEVRAANGRGVRVFAETCPHYLYLTEARLRSALPEDAANVVCTPPLRADEDRHALWKGLAREDVQVVATDHCPFTPEDRRRGIYDRETGWRDFTEIPGGLPGVETRVSLAYQGVREGRLTVERWVDAIASAPARLFGLSHAKGSISPGMDADLVIFDPEARRHLDASALHSRAGHSPYEGTEVVGWPAITFSRGRLVAKDGEQVDARGHGRFVPRVPFGWRGR